MQKNHTQPQQPGTSFSCCSQTWSSLVWDGIPFFNQQLSQVSQYGCVGRYGPNSMHKLIPQVFNGIEVRATGRFFHPLHSQILQIVADKPCSVRASVAMLEHRGQLLNLILISLYWECLQRRQSLFIQWGRCCLTKSHLLHPIGAAIRMSLRYSCPTQNLDSSLNIKFCTCSSSSAHVADTSANRPDGEG